LDLAEKDMKKNHGRGAAILCLLGLSLLAQALAGEAAKTLLPAPAGWTMRGAAAAYNPANLYEYIDGAAENFLAYDFQELAVANFEQGGAQVTVEVYRHGNADAAFGIYSSEKPLAGNFLSMGAEGYYENGVLNFLSGPFYVKINSFALPADKDQEILTSFATAVAAKAEKNPRLPGLLAVLPEKDRVSHSERFLLQAPFGQTFLHEAFVADYAADEKKFQCFILRGSDETDAAGMLAQWRGQGTPAAAEKGMVSFNHPFSGKICAQGLGRFVAGVIGDCASPEAYLSDMNENMKKQR
jgi:hypothetical protein